MLYFLIVKMAEEDNSMHIMNIWFAGSSEINPQLLGFVFLKSFAQDFPVKQWVFALGGGRDFSG